MKEKKERLWWLFWLPNMARYLIWPGLEFAWSTYPAIRMLTCLVVGFFLAPAIRLAWNAAWPQKPINTLEALLVLVVGIGLLAFLTKTGAGNDILGTAMALVILASCLFWLLAAALPALTIYALAHLGKANSYGKTAYRVYLGPIEWVDRKFFLAQRTGN